MELQVIDYILLALLIIMVIWGFVRGIVCQIGDLAAFVLAIVGAHMWGAGCAQWLQRSVEWSPTACNIVAYIGVFLVIYLTIRIIASFIKQLTKLVKLGWIDAAAGGVFGAFKLLLFASILINLAQTIAPEAAIWSSPSLTTSISYEPVRRLLPLVMDAVWK